MIIGPLLKFHGTRDILAPPSDPYCSVATQTRAVTFIFGLVVSDWFGRPSACGLVKTCPSTSTRGVNGESTAKLVAACRNRVFSLGRHGHLPDRRMNM